MTLNRPLLEQAVTFVERAALYSRDFTGDTNKHWDQGDWSRLNRDDFHPDEVKALSQPELFETCGTAYCVAGYVTSTLPGYRAEIELGSWIDNDGAARVSASLLEYLNNASIVHYEEDELSHARLAQEALGLTRQQADALFDGGNELEDVRDLVREFIAEEDRLEAQQAADYERWQQQQQ